MKPCKLAIKGFWEAEGSCNWVPVVGLGCVAAKTLGEQPEWWDRPSGGRVASKGISLGLVAIVGRATTRPARRGRDEDGLPGSLWAAQYTVPERMPAHCSTPRSDGRVKEIQ